MKIQEQVCPKIQAKRLRELGVCQGSYFSWCGHEEHRLMDGGKSGIEYGEGVFIGTTEPLNSMEANYRQDVPSANPFAAAFTVSEMAKMIGRGTKAGEKLLDAVNERLNNGLSFVVSAYDVEFLSDTMIELIEGGVLLIEDCNIRLRKK